MSQIVPGDVFYRRPLVECGTAGGKMVAPSRLYPYLYPYSGGARNDTPEYTSRAVPRGGPVADVVLYK